ncbi:MAG: hypothetical protein JWM33_2590 [Caulobacteraceae bacterium]|nr:hypothetical protein [Caulobacteraceae bacterium]
MREDAALTALFACPVEGLLAVLPDEADPIWNASLLRQGRFPVHRATRSIMFRWLETLSPAGPQPVMSAGDLPEPLSRTAADCAAAVERHYGGTLVRLLLVELTSGAKIAPHRDSGALLSSTHRCHLPVETNPEVLFNIDGTSFHLEAGMVYEMDNMRLHAVENRGSTRRVHLVCNILPAGGLV